MSSISCQALKRVLLTELLPCPHIGTLVSMLYRIYGFEFQMPKNPLKSTILKVYVSGLERNYEAALLEGRESLAKRFRELLDKYEKQIK